MINLIQVCCTKHPPKFKLGDKVVTKRLGLPASGMVVAISAGPYFTLRADMTGTLDLDEWKRIYPDYQYKSVYQLVFDRGVAPDAEFNSAEDRRDCMFFKSYPEDDLEVFE